MNIVHIIPTYNEAENIGKMIETIQLLGRKNPRWKNSILIVDDQSPDGTAQIVKKYKKDNPHIHLLSKKKEGLGKALILGYDYAMKTLHADVVIPNDADFQWDPYDYPKLMEKMEEGYDVVVASRHIKGGKALGWNWFRELNHEISNSLLAWWVAGVHEVRDHAGNFKAIRVKGILERVSLSQMQNVGFSFQLHILYELSKVGAKFKEVPVVFKQRRLGKSKIGFNKYYIRDIVEYVRSSLLIRADRSKKFVKYLIVGAIGFLLQTLISKYFISFHVPAGVAVSFGAEAAIMSNFLFNNKWTFRHHKITGIKRLFKFLQFNIASVGAIIIQFVVVTLGTHYFGVSSWFAFMVGAIILLVIPYSYFVYNRIIWKTHIKTA